MQGWKLPLASPALAGMSLPLASPGVGEGAGDKLSLGFLLILCILLHWRWILSSEPMFSGWSECQPVLQQGLPSRRSLNIAEATQNLGVSEVLSPHNLRTKRDIFLRLRSSSHTGRNPRQLEHRGEVTGKRCAVSWIPEGKNGVSHIVAPRGPGVCLHAEDAEVLRHWVTCLRSKDIQDNSEINEKNDVLKPATTWMNLKIVVQSERSQAKENSYSIVPLIKPLENEN